VVPLLATCNVRGGGITESGWGGCSKKRCATCHLDWPGKRPRAWHRASRQFLRHVSEHEQPHTSASARLFTCSLAFSRAVIRVGRTPSPSKAAPSRSLLNFRMQPRLAASGVVQSSQSSLTAPAYKQAF
jgi:hypothetical protein